MSYYKALKRFLGIFSAQNHQETHDQPKRLALCGAEKNDPLFWQLHLRMISTSQSSAQNTNDGDLLLRESMLHFLVEKSIRNFPCWCKQPTNIQETSYLILFIDSSRPDPRFCSQEITHIDIKKHSLAVENLKHNLFFQRCQFIKQAAGSSAQELQDASSLSCSSS